MTINRTADKAELRRRLAGPVAGSTVGSGALVLALLAIDPIDRIPEVITARLLEQFDITYKEIR